MTNILLEKYSGNVPRYTSYPTAAQFGDGVSSDHYAKWLSEVDPEKPISLYLHIPDCHKMCWYCACHTNITSKYAPVAHYAELLKKEMKLVAKHLKTKQKVSFIHWGGGSPNMLSPEDFTGLISSISDHFTILDGANNAMEIDPRSLTREKAIGYVKAGINRVSLGVQDFNPHVQKLTNRIQPFEMVRDVVGWLRGAGVESINLDLMYGLPGQTLEDVVNNVVRAVQLWPDRLAVFGYAHVPWMKPHQKMIDEDMLPSPELRLEMAEVIAAQLVVEGYVQIGFDHFAKPDDPLTLAYKQGTLHRNFQGYTTDTATTLIGFGSSAIGHLEKGFVQNTTSMRTYANTINNEDLATNRGVFVTNEDHLRWAVIEQLLCHMSVDLDQIYKKMHIPPKQQITDMYAFQDFEKDGLITRNGNAIKMTDKGRPFIRFVAAAFDTHLAESAGVHSRGV